MPKCVQIIASTDKTASARLDFFNLDPHGGIFLRFAPYGLTGNQVASGGIEGPARKLKLEKEIKDMNRKSILALLITLVLIVTFTFPALSVFGQAKHVEEQSIQMDQERAARVAASMRIVDRYSERGDQKRKQAGKAGKQTDALAQKKERPEWAGAALRQSLIQLQQGGEKYAVEDAQSEFSLLEAMKDGRGFSHIRLTKKHKGVEIFGGERIAHLDDKNVLLSVSGRVFRGVKIDTTPVINETQAIASAKAALDPEAEVAEEPTVKLFILPEQVKSGDETVEGATLVFKVDLQTTNGDQPDDSFSFFVNALDGSIVWQLNNQRHVDGLGASLYSGAVTVDTYQYSGDVYLLQDTLRSNSRTVNANNGYRVFTDFTDDNNAWGTLGNTADRQTVAVDAHFGVAQSWDFFLNRFGRYGADGNGGKIISSVHYVDKDTKDAGKNTWPNASGGGNRLYFGDGGKGNNMTFGPLVSLDIVGHEFTHCVVDATANLTYANESGAIDESFADIFGTAIEFYTRDMFPDDPDFDANYTIGEKVITASPDGNLFLRSMADPTLKAHPNHYSNRVGAAPCTPTKANDQCGVHTDSGIMNYVYYLLCEGGTHPITNVYVPAISRTWTEDMFYTVLVAFLTPSSRFIDVANAMVEVANAYGIDERRAVERAWFAVGVLPALSDPMPTPDLTRSRIMLYSMLGDGLTTRMYNDGWMQWMQDYSGQLSRNWSHIISMGPELFYYNASNGSAAVGRTGAEGYHTTTRSFPRGYFKSGWSSITWHEGYLFFYDKRDGSAGIGQITSSGYRTIRSYPVGYFGLNWTHVVSAQGFLIFYNQSNGVTAVGDWVYDPNPRWQDLSYYNLLPDWSLIIDGGVRGGAETGILFYNKNNATYEVGDIGAYGNLTFRDGGERWAYTFIRLGYTDVIRVSEGLMLYNENERKARVGFLLTPGECERFGLEPFQTVKDLSEAYFPNYYTHIQSHSF